MGGHIEVQNAPPVMGQYQEHVKNLETDGGDSKEVDRDQLLDVILQERAPGLRRRLATAHHVFADAGLADVDAELEQLTVNAGCTPTRILTAHPADQIANLARYDGSSRSATLDLPSPEKAEASTMPGKDGLGLNDGQRRAPAAPHPGQPDPHEAVHGSQPGTSSRATLKHADLVAQSQVLQLKGRARTENRGQGGEEHRERNGHRRRIKESIIPFPSDVLRFSRGTVMGGLLVYY